MRTDLLPPRVPSGISETAVQPMFLFGGIMKLKFTLVLFFLAVCGICFAQTKQSEEEDISRFVERYDNAWNHKDTAAIERILAPDYVYFSSKGQVRSRQFLLEELLSPKYKLVSAERNEVKVYLTLGTAVVSSRWKGHGTYDGQEFHDDQRCSIVLARGKQGWLVLSEHCTQIVAP
jgi:ketosteroid isomerase-like protein